MPAALLVDQSLVDRYLERVDRFWNNVEQFGQTLKDLTGDLKDRFVPEAPVKEEPVYQETVTAAMQQPTQDAVVTAEDIDLDALLRDVKLDDGLSM